jgi:hypothetical protein
VVFERECCSGRVGGRVAKERNCCVVGCAARRNCVEVCGGEDGVIRVVVALGVECKRRWVDGEKGVAVWVT